MQRTTGTAILPLNGGGTVAKRTNGSSTGISAPAKIVSGIRDLMIAYPAGGSDASADDKKRLLQLYAKATEGFHEAVAAFALDWLMFHNPRNPFRPTPQDVREMCQQVKSTWSSRVIAQFLGGNYSDRFAWGRSSTDAILKGKAEFTWGPEPLTPGCLIPDQIVFEVLRERTGHEYEQDSLVLMDESKFSAIPDQGFPEGVRDKISEARRKKHEEEETERRRTEYLESLPPDLRKARGEIEHRHLRLKWDDDNYEMPSEDAIIAEAKAVVEREARASAERREARRKELAAKFAGAA